MRAVMSSGRAGHVQGWPRGCRGSRPGPWRSEEALGSGAPGHGTGLLPGSPPTYSVRGGLPQAGLLSRPPTAQPHLCSQTPGRLLPPLSLGPGPYLQLTAWTHSSPDTHSWPSLMGLTCHVGESMGPKELTCQGFPLGLGHVPAGRASRRLTEPPCCRRGGGGCTHLLGQWGEFGDTGCAQEVRSECWWLVVAV